jgi:hypothetical protein
LTFLSFAKSDISEIRNSPNETDILPKTFENIESEREKLQKLNEIAKLAHLEPLFLHQPFQKLRELKIPLQVTD